MQGGSDTGERWFCVFHSCFTASVSPYLTVEEVTNEVGRRDVLQHVSLWSCCLVNFMSLGGRIA